jgi:hypothetical protein
MKRDANVSRCDLEQLFRLRKTKKDFAICGGERYSNMHHANFELHLHGRCAPHIREPLSHQPTTMSQFSLEQTNLVDMSKQLAGNGLLSDLTSSYFGGKLCSR